MKSACEPPSIVFLKRTCSLRNHQVIKMQVCLSETDTAASSYKPASHKLMRIYNLKLYTVYFQYWAMDYCQKKL